MRTLFPFLAVLFVAAAVHAQKATDVFAVVNGTPITAADMPPQVLGEYMKLPRRISTERSEFFKDFVAEVLIEQEAKARGVSARSLTESEVTAKTPEPTPAQIEALFEANRQAFGPRSLDDVRPQLLNYLRGRLRLETRDAFVETLKTKFKAAEGKDINTAAPAETVLNAAGKAFTRRDFDDRFGIRVYDIEADFYEALGEVLESTVFDTVVSLEAKALGIGPGDVIAREITDKMRAFTQEERAGLEFALWNRLRTKYKVDIRLRAPAAPKSVIPVDDDPSTGPLNAAVTVVMFSDFECPACAAAHPVIKGVVAEFAGKVRFVVKDFPLESIHPQAFDAALAANAAAKQGKYFEYTELLYNNQKSLTRDSYKAFGKAVGLNMERFELDFTDPKAADEVRADQADGERFGVNGTPTLFVNGVKIRGGISVEKLRETISEALKPAAARRK
jgi:protein-disulfide isomerase